MDLKEVKKSKTVSLSTSAPLSSVELKSDIVFRTIDERMKENVDKAKSINGIFLYNITKDGQIAKKWSKFYLDNCKQIQFVWYFLHKLIVIKFATTTTTTNVIIEMCFILT